MYLNVKTDFLKKNLLQWDYGVFDKMASGSENGKVESHCFSFGSHVLIVVIMKDSILWAMEECYTIIACYLLNLSFVLKMNAVSFSETSINITVSHPRR